MPKTLRARLYARFSPRPGAEECDSVEKQLAEGQAEAHRRHATEVHEYGDRDVTGRDRNGAVDGAEALEMGQRAGLIRLLDELKRGDLVIVRDISRLARDVFVEEYILRRIHKAGAELVCLRDTYRTDPDGIMIRQVLAAFREREAKVIAAVTQAKMRAHQAAGRRMGRPDRLPLGWKLDTASEPTEKSRERKKAGKGELLPGRMVECPREQAIKRRIIELHEGGFTISLIKKTFEKEHVTFRGSPRWSEKVIRRVLQREGLLPEKD